VVDPSGHDERLVEIGKRAAIIAVVQRDHAELLRLCAARLAPGGLIVFSNNLRRFSLDEAVRAAFEVRDISASTIPFDFSRNARIHVCYELRRRDEAESNS
jgi:23S rRNA (guanine2445-N2)-methyltransferase / 23S rRNA (guanine2069-N7)-methyltransferase